MTADRLLTYVVVLVLVFFIETIFLGSYGWPGFFLKMFIASLPAVVVAGMNLPLWTFLKSATTERGGALVLPADAKITAFGHTIDRPAFLNDVSNFYGRDRPIIAFYQNTNDEVRRAGLGPLKPSPQNEQRLLESMLESARYEMLRRGLPVTDRLNNLIWPVVHDEGLLIESVKLDDGSTAHIMAHDIIAELDREAWAQARQHGIGRYDQSWSDPPNPCVEQFWVPGRGTVKYNRPKSGVMPLFQLQLREVIEAGDQALDPLARDDGGVSYSFPEEWR